MNEQIVILDFGSQYTQVIARRIRECRVYSTILRYDTPAEEIARLNPKGIILSGGPNSVYSPKAPLPDRNVFKLGLPVLGICYGVQLLAQFLGGKVERGQKREYGKGTLTVGDSRCALFEGLPTSLQVWNSHGDKLTRLPKDFVVVGTTENSDYAAIEDRARWSTAPAARRSSPTSSTRSAAVARAGRCGAMSTKRSRTSGPRSDPNASSLA
jgi:GMP synthase (glutamine-hydrolysing)